MKKEKRKKQGPDLDNWSVKMASVYKIRAVLTMESGCSDHPASGQWNQRQGLCPWESTAGLTVISPFTLHVYDQTPPGWHVLGM